MQILFDKPAKLLSVLHHVVIYIELCLFANAKSAKSN